MDSGMKKRMVRQLTLLLGAQGTLVLAVVFRDRMIDQPDLSLSRWWLGSFLLFAVVSIILMIFSWKTSKREILATCALIPAFFCLPIVAMIPIDPVVKLATNVTAAALTGLAIWLDRNFFNPNQSRPPLIWAIALIILGLFLGYVTVGGFLTAGDNGAGVILGILMLPLVHGLVVAIVFLFIKAFRTGNNKIEKHGESAEND